MKIFKYRVKNPEKKSVSGLVEAESEEQAIEILTDKGLEIVSLNLDSSTSSDNKFSFVIDRVKPKDLVAFSRQFSVLISANVTLVESLKILVHQTTNLKLKMVISEVADDIDEGSKLSDALAKKSSVFSNFYINVVKSGETSGKLDEVLNYLADELEKDYDMNSKIKGAMIYPAFVFSGLAGVGVIMMVFVVPKLTDVLAETGGELPLATKILIGVSDFLQGYWWLVLMMLGGFAFGLRAAIKIPASRRMMDVLILRLPIFGKLFQRIYLVRFTRSLQTLIIGGVSISKALTITAEVASNAVYREIILEAKKEVEDGNSISSVFMAHPEVPVMVSQMISIGEKTGKLDVVLERISSYYGREIDNMIANLMTLMEPIIMVVMGIGVGVMVAAIILPMYNMASSM
jgi:type IV pilus assembly protein PilC